MARYTPSTVRSVHQINSEFEKVKNSIDTMVDREGTAPNQMEAELDMNSNRILNLPAPLNQNEAVTKQYVDAVLDVVLALSGVESIVPIEQPRQLGDGSQTVFDTPASELQLANSFTVYLDGVRQKPLVDYTVDTSGNVVFLEAPSIGEQIDITFFQPNVG